MNGPIVPTKWFELDFRMQQILMLLQRHLRNKIWRTQTKRVLLKVGNYKPHWDKKKTETCIALTHTARYIKLDSRKSVSYFIAIIFFSLHENAEIENSSWGSWKRKSIGIIQIETSCIGCIVRLRRQYFTLPIQCKIIIRKRF